MTTKVRTMAAIALLVAGLGLAGCGSDEKTVTVNGDKVTVDRDGDGVKIESDVGSSEFGTGSLPEDFPEADVPVVDGTIAGGAKNDTGGMTTWTVIVQTEGGVDAVLAEVTAKLEDAGFTSETSGNYGGSAAAQFTGKYTVGVSVTGTDDQITVSYVVTPAVP